MKPKALSRRSTLRISAGSQLNLMKLRALNNNPLNASLRSDAERELSKADASLTLEEHREAAAVWARNAEHVRIGAMPLMSLLHQLNVPMVPPMQEYIDTETAFLNSASFLQILANCKGIHTQYVAEKAKKKVGRRGGRNANAAPARDETETVVVEAAHDDIVNAFRAVSSIGKRLTDAQRSTEVSPARTALAESVKNPPASLNNSTKAGPPSEPTGAEGAAPDAAISGLNSTSESLERSVAFPDIASPFEENEDNSPVPTEDVRAVLESFCIGDGGLSETLDRNRARGKLRPFGGSSRLSFRLPSDLDGTPPASPTNASPTKSSMHDGNCVTLEDFVDLFDTPQDTSIGSVGFDDVSPRRAGSLARAPGSPHTSPRSGATPLLPSLNKRVEQELKRMNFNSESDIDSMAATTKLAPTATPSRFVEQTVIAKGHGKVRKLRYPILPRYESPTSTQIGGGKAKKAKGLKPLKRAPTQNGGLGVSFGSPAPESPASLRSSLPALGSFSVRSDSPRDLRESKRLSRRRDWHKH